MSRTKKINIADLLPTEPGMIKEFGQIIGSANAAVCANILEQHSGLTVIVTQDMQQTTRLYEEIQQFSSCEILQLPDWETLPYDSFSPHQDIVSERLSCLYKLTKATRAALLIPITTLMQKICPTNYLVSHVFMMKKGQQISREELRLQLENAGYRSVHQVMEHGEYVTRGALFDIFPMGSDQPYRLDFFDDVIDSIRTFNIESQRTLVEIDQVQLLPAHEFPFDKTAIDLFRSQWRERFEVRRENENIYQQVSQGILPTGIEYWQRLFFNEPLTPLFSYLPKETLIINTTDLQPAADKFWYDIQQRYESRRIDPMRPLLPPEQLWCQTNEIFSAFKQYPRIVFNTEKLSNRGKTVNLNYLALSDIALQHRHKEPFKLFLQFTEQFLGKIVFSVESEGRREALQDTLQRISIHPKSISSLDALFTSDCTNDESRFYLMIGACENGFIDVDQQFAIITENDLLGRRTTYRKKETKSSINTDSLVRSLAELTPGNPVVHLEHGVGRYAGLTTLEAGGITAEYLILLYANDTKLYVPVASLNLISRYSGGDLENAPLHKLGTDAWSKARQKAAERVRDVAAELLDIYAQREAKAGFKFVQDREQYELFCQGFPYQVTDDQQQAIGAVIGDMCSANAMDRLVCGDVGFGKTEVAMRAAFLAVNNHKQVAILVPTTLLAQQHFDNFQDRFANWPIRVEVLSRFKTAKQQMLILKDIAEGKVDIVVGTHKLLQPDIIWKDLGLLIVDEEHRFGVRHKEKIKAMRANVDILTLTATPIPRTLNMAMSGMRDLSIIATPPARRLAVKTFVREYDELVIREAILREILRGGQVYFLHNDVTTIEATQQKISELVPEARVAVGHGQMHERDLERIIHDFHRQTFNVLICTTIVETGIDIPNANTIIIERADKFGLAQLHQLRGRVGRSYHQAYAYLLTPHPKLITKDATKRLEAISMLEDLGAGFALATHDLEIRGAGELLGEDQSGQIETIGFNLYMELLEEAVNALKEGKEPSLESLLTHQQTEVDLRIPTLIPDDFIVDVNMRLSLYKRIASTKDEKELHEIKVEMIDRFGLLPDPVKFLLEVALLRQQAENLGIIKIEFGEKGGFIEFGEKNKVSVEYLIEQIQSDPRQFRLDGSNRLKLQKQDLQRLERIQYISKLLNNFNQQVIN